MPRFGNAIERDGDAFSRAFESARDWERNTLARANLRQAIADLVDSGALLPHEARAFEERLILSRGRFQPDDSWASLQEVGRL